jgi:hypothetical protein
MECPSTFVGIEDFHVASWCRENAYMAMGELECSYHSGLHISHFLRNHRIISGFFDILHLGGKLNITLHT